MQQVGRHEVTYNRQFGSGLGLYHAKKAMEKFNGKLIISSDPVAGTNVCLIFPRISTPKWFCDKLKIATNTTMIILNDRSTQDNSWGKRFRLINSNIPIISFNILDFYDWISKDNKKCQSFFHFFDLESDNAAIEIMRKLNIQKNSVLITNNFEDSHLHEKCVRLGIKLVPKHLAWIVPISVK